MNNSAKLGDFGLSFDLVSFLCEILMLTSCFYYIPAFKLDYRIFETNCNDWIVFLKFHF